MDLKYNVIRNISYLRNKWDDIGFKIKLNYNDICGQTVDFFRNGSQLVWPAKSYFVAIVYAECFVYYFNEYFYDMLDDKELLQDDMFFKRYSDSKELYDNILRNIDLKEIMRYASTQKTIDYFKKEFMLCK